LRFTSARFRSEFAARELVPNVRDVTSLKAGPSDNVLAHARAPCASRAKPDAAHRASAWQWHAHGVVLVTALLCALFSPCARSARAQVDLPAGRMLDRITVAADGGTHWVEGVYDVYVLHGNCYINHGLTYARSQQAVLWVERGDAQSQTPHKVIAYLEGEVEINYQPGGEVGGEGAIRAAASATLKDRQWFGRFYSALPVDVRPMTLVGAPAERPEIYARAAANLAPAAPQAQAAQAQPAQFIEPIPTPPPVIGPAPDMVRIRVQGRSHVQPDLEIHQDPNSTQTIVIGKGGVNIIVDGLDEFGSIDVDTDNLIVWTSGPFLQTADGQEQRKDQPLEIYMEGNVVFRQGERTIYAQRMYYDVRREIGIVLGAELLTPVENYQGLVRLRADIVQQIARDRFVAQNASITTSRLGIPTYELTSATMTYDAIQHPRINPFTGAPEVDGTGAPIIDTEQLATSRNNVVYINELPVFYWPFLATDLERPNFYIDDIQVRNDQVFGTQVLTDINAYQVLGMRDAPVGTDWIVSADYLSKRGFGYGTTFDYERQNLFGVPAGTGGFLDAWAIKDHGDDNLGLLRRDVPPEKSYRGRVLWQHRSLLPDNFQVTGEVGLISDFNFLEQYFEREYDQLKDQTTDVELKQYLDNSTWSLVGSVRLNPFFTETEWLPRLDHFWIAQPLVNDWLSWYEHTSLAFARFRTANPPTDPAQAALWGPLPWEAPASALRVGERLATRHELDLPFALGAFKFSPYVLGELARWGENLDFDAENRAYGAGGIRASTSMWAVDPQIRSELFNVNGLAHKVVFETDVFYAQSTQDLDTLPLYDQIDDNNIEAYRRWFPFFDFGGPPPVPTRFDERYYALRRGLGSYVASPSMEIADDLFAARLGARQRWQTKRGPLSNPHIVDWITFDVDATLFPNPNRDNFGTVIGLVDYDFRWHVGDRTTLVSDGYFDFFDDAPRYFTVGGFIERPPRGSMYLGFRSLEGPITSNVLVFNYSYRMSPKWLSTFGTTYDFHDSRNIGQNLMLTRIGESFLVSVIVNVDTSKNNVGANLAIQPRFLQGRLGPAAPVAIPAAGLYGIE
jgi:hypothetical protein